MRVMYRVFSAILPALVASVGSAAASSSIISLPAADAGASPSVIARGIVAAPRMEAEPVAAVESNPGLFGSTDSVPAVGADAIPPNEKPVASIVTNPEALLAPWLSSDAPLIIRGSAHETIAASREE